MNAHVRSRYGRARSRGKRRGYRHGASCVQRRAQLRHPGRGGYNRYQRYFVQRTWFWVVALVVAYGTPVYAAPGPERSGPAARGRRGDGSGLSDSAALEEEETPPYIICIRCPDNTSRRGDQRRRKTLAGPRRTMSMRSADRRGQPSATFRRRQDPPEPRLRIRDQCPRPRNTHTRVVSAFSRESCRVKRKQSTLLQRAPRARHQRRQESTSAPN